MKNKMQSLTRRILIVVFIFYSTSYVVKSQVIKGSWQSITYMPTARWFPATAVFEGKIFVFGGNTSASTASLNIVEVYNPLTDAWETKKPMPSTRSQLSACTLNGKIYVIGGSSGPSGWTPVPNVDIYDPLTDTWSKGADMPNPRAELGLVAVNDKIYAIGGITGSSSGSKSVDIYEPASNTWSKGADMPTARGTMPACELNGKIYVFGGTNGGASGWNHFAQLEVYDIETNTWSTKKEMPESRSHLTGCVFNNKIFALGGTQLNLNLSFATMSSYNPETDTWENEPSMLTPREAFTAVVINNKIYAIGGTQAQNGLVAFSNSEVYDPTPKVVISSPEMRLPAAASTPIGKLFVPNAGDLNFIYKISENIYDGSLFELRNDSLVTTQNFGLSSNKKYQLEILAVSENNDSIKTLIKLETFFEVNAIFTAPNGFLLQSSNKKVMLDVLASKSPGNGFIANSNEIYENMKNAVEPFNNIDLIYTSHAHPCHFDAELILNAMLKNPNAISVMGVEAKKAMEKYFNSNPEIVNRIFAPEIPSKSFLDTTLAGIQIRLTNIPHGSFSTLGINIILDSIQFVHFDDYNNLATADYETIGFTQLPTDVAFIGALLLNGEQNIIKNNYTPNNYITVSHIMNISSTYDAFITKAETLQNLNYQINIPRWPMEIYSYKKANNRILQNTINNAPVLNRSFNDISVETNKTVTVNLSNNAFKEIDLNDKVTYSITINNLPLPEWAIYDTVNQKLFLTPTKAKNHLVRITATDTHLSFANTSFTLEVTQPTEIENQETNSGFLVFPNPTQSIINIECLDEKRSNYSVNLYNMLGEKIYSGCESQNSKMSIDISTFSQSLMFLIITSNGASICHKIIKN